MTAAEITALRKEFEDAILIACGNFKTKTGVSVAAIYLGTETVERIGEPNDTRVIQVCIRLESL